MANSTLVFAPGQRITNQSGDPVSGAYVEFFEAGTSTQRPVYSDIALTRTLGPTVYADGAGYPVASSGSSTRVLVYTGTGDYKIHAYAADGSPLWSHDAVSGAIDTSLFAAASSTSGVPSSQSVTVSEDTTLDASYNGKFLNVDCSGEIIAISLQSAVSAGNGFRVGIRHDGAANQVQINAAAAQFIAGAGVQNQSLALVGYGETIWLRSNGVKWLVESQNEPLIRQLAPGVIRIIDRLTAPPGSPVPGSRYLLSGAGSGAWAGYATGDIAESNGNAGWIRYQPAADCGWIAYVIDEDEYYFHQGTTWDIASTTKKGLARFATNAEVDAAIATGAVVSPASAARMQGVAKAWGAVMYSGGVPTLADSYNVASIGDTGAGILTVTMAAAVLGNANYSVVATGRYTNAIVMTEDSSHTKTATEFRILSRELNNAAVDPNSIYFAVFGDPA